MQMPKRSPLHSHKLILRLHSRIQELNDIENKKRLNEYERRVLLREQLKKHNKILSGVAKGAGVITSLDYANFANAGYKGLYDGLSAQGIKTKKRLKKKDNISDYMGSEE